VDGDSVWRVKGSHALNRHALAVLRELWHWRNKEALAANRPPFFILSHEKMAELAEAAVGRQAIEPLLPPRMSPRRRDSLVVAIRAGLAVPPNRHPEKVRHHSTRPTEAEMRCYRELEKRRDAHAHQLDIDPTLIASRATLGDLARDWERHAPELMNWQRELMK
jgi:ribonuclease D